MPGSSVPADLAAAWRATTADPVRVLVPAGGQLLLHAAEWIALREAWSRFELRELAALWLGLECARFVVATPLRLAVIRAGAAAFGHTPSWARLGPLLGVQILSAAAFAVGRAAPAIPLALLAAWLATEGWLTASVALLGVGALASWLGGVLARAALALAPAEAVLGRRGGLAATFAALRGARTAGPALFVLVVAGDAAVTLGALLCGAGALPGYPLGELAILHRWSASHAPETP